MPLPRMVAWQLVIAMFLLLGLEAGARVAFTVREDYRAGIQWYSEDSGLGWVLTPNYRGRDICNRWRAFDDQGLLVEDAEKLASGKASSHVVFLGDSNTYGFCLESRETFVAAAGRKLPDVAMVNLGVPAYSSYQGYKALLKHGDELKPDAIVVSFNFNDRRYVLTETGVDGERAFSRFPFSDFLERSYLFRFIRKISGVGGEVRLDQLRPRVDLDGYRKNLENIARWGRQRGVRIVFVLLRDNPQDVELLNKGEMALRRADTGEAMRLFMELLNREKRDPGGSFSSLAKLYLAKAYRQLGAIKKADEIVVEREPFISRHGGFPLLRDVDYNSVMREVAKKHGAIIVDAAIELEKLARVFFDFCHFTAEGHGIVGRLVADALKRAGGTLNPPISGTDRN